MRDSLTDAVHAVICHGLSLRDRIESGTATNMDAEQAALADLLAPLAANEILDAEEEVAGEFQLSEAGEGHAGLSKATMRYALTCWLDDFLIAHSSWSERWHERTLESALFKTSVRDQKFWEEARYAEIRGDIDVLDVMYTCVMLGFRGNWRDKPDQVEAWVKRIEARLNSPGARAEAVPMDWARVVQETTPATDLPLRRMQFTAMLSLSLLVTAGLVFYRHLAHLLGGRS